MNLRPNIIPAVSLSLLLLALVLVLGTTTAVGDKLVASDDFTGQDYSPLDDEMWRVYHRETDDVLRIELDKVKVEFNDGGWSFARTWQEYDSHQLTFLMDWNPHVMNERPVDMRFMNNNSGTIRSWCNLRYQLGYGGWVHDRHTGGSMQQFWSGDYNVNVDTWYQLNMTIDVDRVNLTVTNKENGAVLYSVRNATIDKPTGTLMVQFGMLIEGSGYGQVWFDNFRLYDNSIVENTPPSLDPVPELSATEDEPYTYDFTDHIFDPDDPLVEVTIDSDSPYVQSIDGFEVTFLFPNGVLAATIPLVLSDGTDVSVVNVNFTITPVNDPPGHNVGMNHSATEDVPYVLDLTPYVWDIDNELTDLLLEVDDPYLEAKGLVLTATFPEGVLTYDTVVGLSDGELSTPVVLGFVITPVDDPPVIGRLGMLNITEDQEEVFDVAPYVSDVDTGTEDLRLTVNNPNCTVENLTLRLLFSRGDVVDILTIKVTDGNSTVQEDLWVRVLSVDDAPVLGPIPSTTVVEGFPETVDLSPYVYDEDTPVDQLVLMIDDPAALDISGMTVTLLVDAWVDQFELTVTVSDGTSTDVAPMVVQVTPVNDDPVILSIGGMTEPYVYEMDEGTTVWLQVLVEDEDSEVFEYSVVSGWGGVTAYPNGTVKLVSEWNVVDNFTASVEVTDDMGGSDRVDLTVVVLNVNDPPGPPVISLPENNSVHRIGSRVSFSASVTDPDIEHGQVLTVTWTSDRSGELAVMTSEDVLEFDMEDLPVGKHVITVSVNDGEYTSSSWVRITVEEEPVEWTSVSYVILVIVIVAVLGVAALLVSRMRRT